MKTAFDALTHTSFGFLQPNKMRESGVEIYPANSQLKGIMISNATKRSILRWIHLILGIPILGYIYGEASEVQQYAAAVRSVFVPVIILSGFWMYAGVFFAIIGVAV